MYAPVKNEELPVLVGVNWEMFDGTSFSASPTFTTPILCIVVSSITVVGVGVVKSFVRLMREPVTVTSSRIAGALGFVLADGAVCACTEAVKPNESATA